MGEALAATGIGNDLFRAAHMWLRRLPGALAVATVFACAAFAAVCGSSPVTAATIGAMAVPEMMRRGYDKSLALGTAAAGGTLGILIPPSVPMIIYGVLTETSIGDLFIAGILPGIMMAFLFSATVILKVMLRPQLAPPLKEGTPWPVKFRALGGIAPVLVLSVLVIGSIYWGIATPTEAGAVGAAGAIAIAGIMGYLRWSVMHRMLDATVRTTAMFVIPAFALVLLMYVAYRGFSVILFAPICALLAVLATDPSLVLPVFSGIFMRKLVGFIELYFPVFLLGAVFGKVIELSGFSKSIVSAVIGLVVLGTSFLSGIFGMAGGMILMGLLLMLMSVPAAMILHGITQAA